jgi:hypothetical protein
MDNYFDKIIIGAGLYGLYAADFCSKRNEKVLVLEYDEQPFMRATYINQARVHMGYHYPRSYTTAIASAGYYDRFHEDFKFSIKDDFKKVYAVSKNFSWTNAKQFQKFCTDSNIDCKPVNSADYFKDDLVEGTFLSTESSYDAKILLQHLLGEIADTAKTEIIFNARLKRIEAINDVYKVELEDGSIYSAPFVLNSTYASVNQVLSKTGFEKIDIKYELCEIILCRVSNALKNVGITVMDGPFFSLMPFGKTGLHSLTAVSYTPHKTSLDVLPTFECQQRRTNNSCNPGQLANCNSCDARPLTAWKYMSSLAKKYLRDDIELEYVESLYSIKTILKSSEIDDARPTVIKKHSSNPTFISVLSGKINTVYDLNQTLIDGNNC